jgi:aminoglycoside 6-adenylyltransferase
MNQTAQAYEQLIKKFAGWGETQSDIRAVIVLGSRARVHDHPADEWADLDVMFVTSLPERYLYQTDWLENIGKPWLSFLDSTPTGGEKERRILFEGGLDVDLAVVPNRVALATVWLLRIQKSFPFLFQIPSLQRFRQKVIGFYDMVNRGIRVLLDKDGIAAYLKSAPVEHPSLPTESEFLEVVNNFWYNAVWTAKHLRRGELWRAKSCCDGHMKWLLLQVIEWHAQVTKSCDTWHRGHFLEEWADSRAVNELRVVYAHYDKDDLQRALIATMDLFRWLAIGMAERLEY